MKRKHLKIQVEWDWLESHIMPDINDTYELSYHQEQFDQDALREYMQFILGYFLDKPEPVYFSYWEKALQPTAQHFKSFKSYFADNDFKFTDERFYYKLFFISLILWRNFAYNGTENSNKKASKNSNKKVIENSKKNAGEIYQMACKFHNERMGQKDAKKTQRELLNEKRKGKNVDVTLGKKGIKDSWRGRSYVYWTGKLFGPLSKFENVETDERIINLIGLLFRTATNDFKEKYESYLKKETKSSEKKDWNKYMYDSIRSYKNRHPAFQKELLKELERFILKLKDGEKIKLSDPVIPEHVLRMMNWSNADEELTTKQIEKFIEKYSRHRPYFTKLGIWPSQYDNPNSETRKEIAKAKRKAKINKLAKLHQSNNK